MQGIGEREENHSVSCCLPSPVSLGGENGLDRLIPWSLLWVTERHTHTGHPNSFLLTSVKGNFERMSSPLSPPSTSPNCHDLVSLRLPASYWSLENRKKGPVWRPRKPWQPKDYSILQQSLRCLLIWVNWFIFYPWICLQRWFSHLLEADGVQGLNSDRLQF